MKQNIPMGSSQQRVNSANGVYNPMKNQLRNELSNLQTKVKGYENILKNYQNMSSTGDDEI